MEKLQSIKTYILIAWIFALLALVGFGFWCGYLLIGVIIIGALLGALTRGLFFAAPLVAAIPATIIALIFVVPTALVFVRLNRMKRAADNGDVRGLKGLNSTGWAIVALIFAAIIPGIMLLVAHDPIEQLDMTSAAVAPDAGVTVDSLDKISKLKSLLDSGAITKEEFESQKNSILHPGTAPRTPTIEDELRRLKQLCDSGALMAAEYEELKKKSLEKL